METRDNVGEEGSHVQRRSRLCFVTPAFARGGQRQQPAKGFGFSDSRPLIYAD